MAFSIKLTIEFTEQTLEDFKRAGFAVPWHDALKEYEFASVEPSTTIMDLTDRIDLKVERLYEDFGGPDPTSVQTRAVWRPKVEHKLPFQDLVTKHLKCGDTIVLDMQVMQVKLRYGLNDRVLCNLGPRWVPGHIVETNLPDAGGFLPYLVKTDPLPGLPSRNISVPLDEESCCIQEVCFDPQKQLHLVKAAARVVAEYSKVKLRFSLGDRVVCRISNADDGLEQWVAGVISEVWPKLPGVSFWELGGSTGHFPDAVPYRVDFLSGAWVFGHRDDHTLVRAEGLQPQKRVRGVSQRMEVIEDEGGNRYKIDHGTGRRKRLINTELDDDGGD
mmetsp:Transcript_24092/g.64232  ORF Transcript_24092/g.64232 Transcript_24092/m.64232 type:complete len:331 (+) Transcript_24092:80-1072(+)